MKKTYTFLSAIVLACTCNITGAQTFEWAAGMGGAAQDEGKAITVDNSGNVYTIGYFDDTVDFDPGAGTYNLISAGGTGDVFVSKLDPSGNFLWAKRWGGTSADYGYSIAIDDSGNVYTTGVFRSTVDFDPGTGTFNISAIGTTDQFISKLDASGNFLWAKNIGGPGNPVEGNCLALDDSGNIYTTGDFAGTIDFDPGTGTYNLVSIGNGFDIFVSKYDASGNFLWAKAMGGTNGELGNSITIGDSGNVYYTGLFGDTVDFDPGAGTYNLTSAGGPEDIFVSKLDASGNFLWAKSMEGLAKDVGFSIAVDASGNVYTTGYFGSTVDFDPGAGIYNLSAVSTFDVFVSKLDASGNFLWARSWGGSNNDVGNSITVDAYGDVYTTGFFRGQVDFDPDTGTYNLTAIGNDDVFISKLDASGNLLWAVNMGGQQTTSGNSITVDASQNLYVTGRYSYTTDFDPDTGIYNLSSVMFLDCFVVKFRQCPITFGTETVTACNTYTSPSGDET